MENQNKRGGKRPGSGRKPGTPNKLTKTMKEKASAYGDDALQVMVELMHDPESPAAVRLSAATALLDRGFGKPRQAIDVKEELTLSHIPWDELREITRQAVEKAAKKHAEVIEGRYERLGLKKEYHSD